MKTKIALLFCTCACVIGGTLAANAEQILYSTQLTGISLQAIAVDRQGNVYVTGAGSSPGVFVAKLNPGGRLMYSRHIAGTLNDNSGIAVDWQGNAYVTGATSGGLITTPNALRPTLNDSCLSGGVSSDAFVVKLDHKGNVIYATYLGGCDIVGTNIAVDLRGNAYAAGMAVSELFPPQLPTTPGALDSTPCLEFCGFVAKLNPTGSSLLYSTYFGTDDVFVADIAVNLAGEAYLAGSSLPPAGVPTTANAFEPNWPAIGSDCPGGGPFAFAARLNTTGSALVYGTYLGGGGSFASNDCNASNAEGLAVDLEGNAYVVGSTLDNFPTTPTSVQPTYGGGLSNGFLTKLNPAGTSLVYSTYIGSGSLASGVGVDLLSNADVVWGSTSALDAQVAHVNAGGTALVNLSISAAVNAADVKIAVDYFGNIYVATSGGLVTKINPN